MTARNMKRQSLARPGVKQVVLVVPLLFLIGLPVVGAPWEVRVTADSVNLRAAPGMGGEVVSQVSDGDILTAEKEEGEWVQVVPPARVDLWVYAELVEDGVVAVPKLRVRAGPGINYKPVGRLDAGDLVVVKESRLGWLSIAPPPGSFLWIHRDYIEPLAVASSEPGSVSVAPRFASEIEIVRKPPKPGFPVTVSVKPRADGAAQIRKNANVSQTETSIESSSRRKTPVAGDIAGRRVEVTGILGPTGGPVWRRPGSYRLVKRDRYGRAVTACYITGNDARLAEMAGRSVRIIGTEYWVQGVRYPVVHADRLVPASPGASASRPE